MPDPWDSAEGQTHCIGDGCMPPHRAEGAAMTDTPPPTQDDLAAGRELDAQVATHVFGCHVAQDYGYVIVCCCDGAVHAKPGVGLPVLMPFSTDVRAAWQVLDEMVWRVGTANIHLDMEDYGRGAGTSPAGAERAVWVTIGEHTAFGPVCEAICKAALAAVTSG